MSVDDVTEAAIVLGELEALRSGAPTCGKWSGYDRFGQVAVCPRPDPHPGGCYIEWPQPSWELVQNLMARSPEMVG